MGSGSSAGSAVANGAAQAEPTTGSGSSAATGSGSSAEAGAGSATGNAATGPTRLELQPGETLTDPVIETLWDVPGGAVTATVIEAEQRHKLVVWGHGKRYDVVQAYDICHIGAEIRHVRDGQIVFRCAAPNPGQGSGSLVYSWLIRWRKDKNAPVRHRYWQGDGAAREPRWARSRGEPLVKDGLCCCEATLEDRTTYAWEDDETCKPSEEDERSAFCVARVKCRDIPLPRP